MKTYKEFMNEAKLDKKKKLEEERYEQQYEKMRNTCFEDDMKADYQREIEENWIKTLGSTALMIQINTLSNRIESNKDPILAIRFLAKMVKLEALLVIARTHEDVKIK